MKVYRVEHRTYGHGPYLVPVDNYPESGEDDTAYYDAVALSGKLCSDHAFSDEHPPPTLIYPNEVCAFESRQDLDRWFDGWHDYLRVVGYIVRVYETAKPRFDRWGQVTFPKTSAKALTTESI